VPIRLRLAILVTVVTLVVLSGAGVFFVRDLRSSLQNSLDVSLRARADQVGTQLDQPANQPLQLPNGSFGQVLDRTGRILRSTDDVIDAPLLPPSAAAALSSDRYFDDKIRAEPGESQVISVRVLATPSPRKGQIIVVATSREVVDEAVERAIFELLVVGGLVLVLAGPGAWLLARSALRPVERMRAQAADLQTHDAGARLSVPRSRDELARLGVTLNELLGRLHDALERERSFVADAGHELRTPLTVLRGELELARRPGRTAEQLNETVCVAAEETERLIRLAEDLLILARDDTDRVVLERDFDLDEIISASCRSIEPMAQARQVRVEPSGSWIRVVSGDPARLRQALDNVLVNALRESPDGGQVTIAVSVSGDDIEIAVQDEGAGFDEAFLPVAFERFRRPDAARQRDAIGGLTSGAGLGLAIVRRIMRDHGGDATAENRTDRRGAIVRLRWPGAVAEA
jgi:signal transduction histidine kinase